MLGRLALPIIMHIISLLALAFSRGDQHLPRQRIVRVDIVVVGRVGIFHLLVFVHQGFNIAVTCHESKTGSVDALGSLDGKVCVDQENIVVFGLKAPTKYKLFVWYVDSQLQDLYSR